MSVSRECILDQIKAAVDDALAEAPDTVSDSQRKDIRDEILAYAQRVVEACTTEELQSHKALGTCIDNAVAQVEAALRKRRHR
jgi:hypothetical protein